MPLISSPIGGLVESGDGGGGSGATTIRISNNSIAENTSTGVTIGDLSVTSPGTWAFDIIAGHTAGGRVAVSGVHLQTTSTNFDFETATSYAVRVHAVRTSPYAELTQDITINVTNVVESFAPTFLNINTFNAPEGADFDFTLSFSEACDVTITGGAQANQFQIFGTSSGVASADLKFFSQVHNGATDNYVVTVQITSDLTGLTATQTLTASVTSVGAPTVTLAPAIAVSGSGGAWEGTTLACTPGTYGGEVTSVTRKWRYKTGPVDITGATALTYIRQFSDIATTSQIELIETITGPGGTITSVSNALAATISGIIFDFAARNTDGFVTDPARGSHLISNEDVIAAGKHPSGDSVTLYKGKLTGTAQDRNASLPAMLAGFIAGALDSWSIVGVVPTNTPVLVRAAVGSDGGTVSEAFCLSLDDWTIDGTHVVATVHNFSVNSDQLANFGAAGNGELITSYAGWEANATYWAVTTNSTGRMSLARDDSTGSSSQFHGRRLQCIYPEFNINYTTNNLPSKTAFFDIASGSDTSGTGKTAAPFQHPPGDLGAGGVVAAFSVGPDGFATGRSGTYRPSVFTGRNGHLLLSNGGGTSGHPATITVDTGATVIFDGSVLFTGATAIGSGDTGGPWENPNHANIKKKSGLPAAQTVVLDGESRMFLSQFPSPHNPADINITYPGNDGFLAMAAGSGSGQFDAVVTEDPDNQYDVNGTLTAGGYHRVRITHPAIQAQYSADSINLSGVGYAVVHIGGNRLETLLIHSHVPSTGYFEIFMSDSIHMFHVAGGQIAYLAVRGHPYDIRKVGQYAYNGSGVLFLHSSTSTWATISSDLNYGWKPDFDYLTLGGLVAHPLTIRRTGYIGSPVADPLTSPARLAFNVHDLIIDQCMTNPASTRLIHIGVAGTTGQFTNVYMTGSQDTAGIQNEGQVNFDGIYARDMDGTVLTTLTYSGAAVTYQNVDICDLMGVHANGFAWYGAVSNVSAHITLQQFLICNMGIPASTQGGDGIKTRSHRIKNGVLLGRRGFVLPISPFTAYDSATIYTWQFGEGELDLQMEGVLCMGAAGYGNSSVTNATSLGTLIKNTVFLEFYCSQNLDGIRFENCLFLCNGGNGAANTLRSDTDITSRGGTVGSGNKANQYYNASSGPTAHDAFTWVGGITADMQKALTADGSGGYATRNIGLVATALNSSGKSVQLPAFGASFLITDANTFGTTTNVSKDWRPGLDIGTLWDGTPDATFALPVGQGDNNLFQLNGPYYNPPSGFTRGADVYNMVVDTTTSNSHVSGTNTKRTTIAITAR